MSIDPNQNNIPPSSGYPGAGGPGLSQDDRTMAMLAYLLGIFTGFIGPLVIWLIKKDTSKFVAFHAMQALVLHAVVNIGYILSAILLVVLIGGLMLPVFSVLGLVFSILAGIAANKGEWYEIPVIGKYAHQFAGV